MKSVLAKPASIDDLRSVKYAICTYDLGYVVRHTNFYDSLQIVSDAWVNFEHPRGVGLIYGFNTRGEYTRCYQVLPPIN